MLSSLLISTIIVSGAAALSILLSDGEVNFDATMPKTNSNVNSSNNKPNYAKETDDYLSKLSMSEIQEYVKDNYVLSKPEHNIEGRCNMDDRYQVQKYISELAEKEGRSFTNKYSRY